MSQTRTFFISRNARTKVLGEVFQSQATNASNTRSAARYQLNTASKMLCVPFIILTRHFSALIWLDCRSGSNSSEICQKLFLFIASQKHSSFIRHIKRPRLPRIRSFLDGNKWVFMKYTLLLGLITSHSDPDNRTDTARGKRGNVSLLGSDGKKKSLRPALDSVFSPLATQFFFSSCTSWKKKTIRCPLSLSKKNGYKKCAFTRSRRATRRTFPLINGSNWELSSDFHPNF